MNSSARKQSSATYRIAAIGLFLAAVSITEEADFPPWKGNEAKIIRALEDGEIRSLTPIGHGVTNPYRAEIEHERRTIYAVWKPIDSSLNRTATESYRAEVAAYRLSELLGLHQVPPTVERSMERDNGSLQYWVDGVRRFAEAGDSLKKSATFRKDFARMRLFDRVILNPDRNSSNFLISDRGTSS